MFDVRVQLAHLHGGEIVPMVRREPHDPAGTDIERALARGGQVWRCERCADEVVVLPDDDPGPIPGEGGG